jgi:molecular chaperone GrpE
MEESQSTSQPQEVQSEQVALLEERLLRTLAEQENQRKRAESDATAARKYAAAGLAGDILPIIDIFDRAAAYIPEDQRNQAWVSGIMHVAKQLQEVLSQHGVQLIPAEVGTVFDPSIHEAIGTVVTSDQLADTIVSISEAGYRLHDRVLRPARVMVSEASDSTQ